MSDIEPVDPRVIIQSIDPQTREVVAEWLDSHALGADIVATQTEAANRKAKDPTTAKSVQYWRNVASAARYFAGILRRSGPKPDRAPGGPKHVRRESNS